MRFIFNRSSNDVSVIRYMKFKTYVNDFSKHPDYQADRGYYYKFLNGNIKMIKYVLEDNGFNDAYGYDFTILWSISPIKNELYQYLTNYPKV